MLIRDVLLRVMGNRPSTSLRAAWGVCVLLLGMPLALDAQASTLAGTRISNEATLQYQDADGTPYTLTSNPITLVVGQVAGVDLRPPGSAQALPGGTAVFPHVLRNLGNGNDTYGLSSQLPSGWEITLYADLDGDGLLSATDTLLNGPITLNARAAVHILAAVQIPANVSPGVSESITLTAISQFEESVTDTVQDLVQVIAPPTVVALEKSVNFDRASGGDVLIYAIQYRIGGSGSLSDFQLSDAIPQQTEYIPGSLTLGSSTLTDAQDGDSGTFESGQNRVVFSLGTVSAGDEGSFTFQVQLEESAVQGSVIQNQARADFRTNAGADSTTTEVVETTVALPQLSIEKSVTAPDSATDGDEVTYTIVVRNESANLIARGFHVTDTLPELLQLMEALPSDGLTLASQTPAWALPDLAPGDSTVLMIRALISADSDDEAVTANWAYLHSAAGVAGADSARSIPLFFDDDEEENPESSLALSLTSTALEVSLGEQVPLRVTLLNDGDVDLESLTVFLELPEGSRWVDREIQISGGGPTALSTSLPGQTGMSMSLPSGLALPGNRLADSVRVNGPLVEVHLPGSLTAGDSLSFYYVMVVVSAPSQVMETRATAMGHRTDALGAEEQAVASNEEVSWVQARGNRALETRTLIGKVWVDLNQDGAQSEDEPGLSGVDIWTEDGEMVTTDQVGKFSLVNLRQGRHGLRIDPLTLPLGLRVAGEDMSADLRMVEINGWVSPRVSFALIPDEVAACPVPLPRPLESGKTTSGRQAETGNHVVETTSGPSQDPPRLVSLGPDGWHLWGSASVAQVLSNPIQLGIPPLRTEEARAEDRGQAFLKGPGVEIFHPVDGAVLDTDKLFVGVKGEADQAVALFVGDSLMAEGSIRVDGIHDFIAVPLETGPQTIKVRMLNSWGKERWDSLRVHVSDLPHLVVFDAPEIIMEADGSRRYPVSFRLLDAWGVPVSQGPFATVQAQGATIASTDADPSSVGHQSKADANGFVEVLLEAGREVGDGLLTVTSHEANDTLSLKVQPSIRPLMVVGVGSVSLGAGPDAFGAVTARGQVGEKTSVTMSYDTRRLDQGREDFGRSTDPLGEGQYAILGDASEQRSMGASRYAFAARVERNRDWLAVGDLQTASFADGLTLSRYTRALSGAAAQVETGPVTWKGFGALTTQTLRQSQIRGDGSSGPYLLETDILPGTERVTMEVRAMENATRIVSQQGLQRFVDYQIDYQNGTLLLKRPVPAADPSGNPVFLMVTYEADGGGPRSAVWGVRATSDLSQMPGLHDVDLIPAGFTFVQDDLALGRFRLYGADLGLRFGSRLVVKTEVARAESPDSTDFAAQVDGTLNLFDSRLNLSGRWLRIGDEFRNPANRGLQGGTQEVRVGAGLTVLNSKVLFEHQRQEFKSRDVNRSQTLLNVARDIRSGLKLQVQLSDEFVGTQGLEDNGGAGQVKITWTPHSRVNLWSEARRQLWSQGDALARGDFLGVGGSLKVTSGISLEARHLRVQPRGDADPYSLTNLGVRSELASGARAWGSYQLSGGIEGKTNAAVLGLSHRIQLGSAWTANALVERRQGVQQAPMGDNVLALPFGGQEENYWSMGLGVEHLPTDAPYRLSAKGEMRNGTAYSNRFLSVAGDLSLNSSLALLSRQELVWTERLQNDQKRESQRLWSLWGMAFRPFDSDALNALAKVEWREDKDPGGVGVLNTPGRNRRLIATGEVIWAPSATWELSGRYSLRSARNTVSAGDGTQDLSVRTTADYAGARAEWTISSWLGFRTDLRALNERATSTREWDIAPSVVLNLVPGIELQGGYRFGELQDPDFAVRSGEGWFLTLGTRITEGTLSNVAGFWRSKLDPLQWQR